MDHDDVYVSATIIYAGEDEAAYVDAERTVKFEPLDLFEAVKKGAVISTDTGTETHIQYRMPCEVYCSDATNPDLCNCWVKYVAYGESDNITFVTLYARENNG